MLHLQTTFINSIDAPSLALLVPIIHRGLRERSADTKKKAAQIVGNMCSLVTEPKDMIPYIGLLIPEVKKVHFLPFHSVIYIFFLGSWLLVNETGPCRSYTRSSFCCSQGTWVSYQRNGRRKLPRSCFMVDGHAQI